MKLNLLLILVTASASLSADDWPQFHGPRRDNRSTDKGLLQAWPKGGPSRIWETSGIGKGYSTVAIMGGRIYTTGSINHNCVITALDLNGKKVWTQTNGLAWQGSYLYSDNGNLALAKPLSTGLEVTGRLKIDDPGENPTWAYPVVCGGRLYLRYGDKLGVYNVTADVGRQQN